MERSGGSSKTALVSARTWSSSVAYLEFGLHMVDELKQRAIVVVAVPLSKFLDVSLLYGLNKLPF